VFHATSFALAPGTLTGSCGDNSGIACRLTWDLSHSTNAAQLVTVYCRAGQPGGPDLVHHRPRAGVRTVLGRLIKRVTERAATATLPVAPTGGCMHKAAVAVHAAGLERRSQASSGPRLDPAQRGLGHRVRHRGADHSRHSRLRPGPAAGQHHRAGVALGFGAANLVRDYLAGIVMLIETTTGSVTPSMPGSPPAPWKT